MAIYIYNMFYDTRNLYDYQSMKQTLHVIPYLL